VGCLFGLGLPRLSHLAEAKRTRDAADFIAGQFRFARHRAVLTGRSVAIVFDDEAGEVGVRVCEDRDRDGVSRSDLAGDVDQCDGPVRRISSQFPQVRIAYTPGVPNPDNEIDPSPLRFGTARMAVFSPTGTASPGTVALLGPGDVQFAVRVAGVTGRTRVLRFDRGTGQWVD
jgi:Tfp pilus assembly protein FimT